MSERATLLNQVFLHHGRVFQLSRDAVRLPGGLEIDIDIIHHNGGAAVLPMFDNGDVLLIRQYRHAAEQYLIEIPAGRVEPGESPIVTAERELEEETGWKAGKIEPVTQFYGLPGYSREVLYCFVATDLTPGTTNFDADEDIEQLRLTFDEARRMVHAGEIKDAKTMLTLLLVGNGGR